MLFLHEFERIEAEAFLTLASELVEEDGIVTAEEANILGGLGAAVAEVVCENCPVPVLRVGIRDEFGRSGDPLALMELYRITAADIAEKAEAAVRMKKAHG